MNIWINKRSDWVIELIDAEYLNVSIFTPLSPCFYIELINKLKNSMKTLINI